MVSTAVELDVRRLSGTIGAEIRGLDIRRPLDADTVAAVRAAWLRHKVVFFPGALLSPDEHVAFARQFGEPTPAHPLVPGIEGHPEVFEIDYGAARMRNTDGDPRRVPDRAGGVVAHRCHLRRATADGFDPERHRDPARRR